MPLKCSVGDTTEEQKKPQTPLNQGDMRRDAVLCGETHNSSEMGKVAEEGLLANDVSTTSDND